MAARNDVMHDHAGKMPERPFGLQRTLRGVLGEARDLSIQELLNPPSRRSNRRRDIVDPTCPGVAERCVGDDRFRIGERGELVKRCVQANRLEVELVSWSEVRKKVFWKRFVKN